MFYVRGIKSGGETAKLENGIQGSKLGWKRRYQRGCRVLPGDQGQGVSISQLLSQGPTS